LKENSQKEIIDHRGQPIEIRKKNMFVVRLISRGISPLHFPSPYEHLQTQWVNLKEGEIRCDEQTEE